jgi:hypothetical protein
MAIAAGAAEIDDAIARYQVRLKVASLRDGKAKFINIGALKVPFVLQGGFARVFRFTDVNGAERAVRCFYTVPRPEFLARFQSVDQFFRTHLPSATAEFSFHDPGIAIKRPPGADVVMPIIEMEWVEGDTLVKHVDRLVTQKDIAGLRNLAGRFVALMTLMGKVGMAHGDLSGENIMVRHKDGSVVIIDYDGVFIPAFRGLPGDGACNPAFQHPDWNNRPYDQRMDDFSALSIYLAIVALAEQPNLWDAYSMHDPQGKLVSDTLLFHREDYQKPDTARIFQDLLRVPNAEVVRLAKILQEACRKPIGQVPKFLDVINECWQSEEALGKLQQAIKLGDDRQVVALYDSSEVTGAPAKCQHIFKEPQIVQSVEASRVRIKQAAELDAAILAGDTVKAVEVLLRDVFINTNLGRFYAARMKPQLLQELGKALHSRNVARVDAIWSVVHLDHEADPYRNAVNAVLRDQDGQRREAFAQLKRSLATIPRDDAAIVSAWNNPLLKKDDSEVKWLEAQVRQAQARLEVAAKLGSMLDDESKEKEALTLWQEHRLEHSVEGAPLRPRVEMVQQRMEALAQVEAAVQKGDDQALLLVWDDLMFRDYKPAQAFAPQVAAARTRLATVDALKVALEGGNDKLIMLLWDTLKVGEMPGSEVYEESVRTRKERWLASRAPRALLGTLEGGELRLTWTWPEGLNWVQVVARLDKYADDPDASLPGQWCWWISRAQYERHGFAKSVAGTPEQLYVRLFPSVRHGDKWLYNLYMLPVRLTVKPARTVTYRLRKDANGEHELEVDAQALSALPVLQIAMSNNPTLDATLGNASPVGWVEEKHRGADGAYRVPLNLSGWRAPAYLAVAPASKEDAQWLHLVPEGGKTIQVA